MHPPHLQQMSKEVNSVVIRLPKGWFVVARMPDWYPRFVIFGWRCFDH